MDLAQQQIIDVFVMDRPRMLLGSVVLGLAGRMKHQSKQESLFLLLLSCHIPFEAFPPSRICFISAHPHFQIIEVNNLFRLLHHRQAEE